MRSLKNILCISILLTSLLRGQIAFFPFTNNSSFNGKWNISLEVPTYIAELIRDNYTIDCVSPKTLLSQSDSLTLQYFISDKDVDLELIKKYCARVNASYAVFGKIETFSINRYVAGESSLANYEHFSCTIEINLRVIAADESQMKAAFPVSASVTRNDLGIYLFGKQSKDKNEFFGFDKIPFGGDGFEKNLVGETMTEFVKNMVEQLRENKIAFVKPKMTEPERMVMKLRQRGQEKTPGTGGEIIMYDEGTGDIFVNLGSAIKIQPSDTLFVYQQGDTLRDPQTNEVIGLSEKRVSDLQVIEVRGPKLCLASALYNKDMIKKGLSVRPKTRRW